jgi:hypothetical protein
MGINPAFKGLRRHAEREDGEGNIGSYWTTLREI